MTISSTLRQAGPYTGNGSAVTFPFAFKVFQTADLLVTKNDAASNTIYLTLDVDFTATLNASQDASPGGAITLTSPLAVGYALTITSSIAPLQPVDLTNNGGFYPKVIMDALDRLTILIQQLITNGLSGGLGGLVTTARNLGAGFGVFAVKSGQQLQFKSLKAGSNVTLSATDNEITINAAGGSSGGGGGGGSERYGIVTGAVGDGTTNDRAAFQAASAGTPSDWPIYVPAGAYNFGGVDLVAGGRRWILEGTVTFPSGKPRQGMFERHNGATGTIDVYYDRAATMFEQRTPFRLGGQSITPALNIGSADPDQSPFGSVLYADGHSNFLALKPEEPFNPMEINLYSYAYSGRANGVAGTNRLLRNITSCPASMPWTPEMVGKCLYFGGVRYKILSRVSDGEVTVAVWPSTPVIFTSAAEATYHFTYTMFRGRCSTSGTAVTWKSGHKFYGYLESWNPSSMIVIGGVPYTVSSVADMDHLTLNASAGTQADVAFVAYAEVDGETTAIRMNHAITGEQLTLMTSAGALDGKGAAFLIKTDRGVGSWNPIVMQNGGHDAMVVAYNAAADKAYVGIGENRRTPACALDVDGDIKNSHLTLRGNSIERHDDEADGSVVAINYYGYLGGSSTFRDFEIYDGKGGLIARTAGATGVMDFVNPPTVGGAPMSGGGLDPDMIDIKPTYVDIGGQGTAKSLRIYQGTAGGGGNWIEIDGVPSTEFPSMSTRGGDTDITLIVDTQGAGGVRFTGGSRSYRAFEVLAPAGSVAWPYVSSHATAPEVGVSGAAANIDLNLVTKGTGRVLKNGTPMQGAFRIDANKTTDVYSLVNGSLQDVKLSIVNANVGAIGTYSTATQRFTFAFPGTYRISAAVMFDCTATGSILGYLFVRKNGSSADADSIKGTVPATSLSPGQGHGAVLSGLLTVVAGDYIKLHNFISLGGTWTTTANAQALTSLCIDKVA